MKSRITYLIVVIVICISAFAGYKNIASKEYIKKGYVIPQRPGIWDEPIAASINESLINLIVDGKSINLKNNRLYMDESMNIMLPSTIISDAFDCAVNLYERTRLVIEKGTTIAEFTVNSNRAIVNDNPLQMAASLVMSESTLYVPIEAIIICFGYQYGWDIKTNQATMANENSNLRTIPFMYNFAEKSRVPNIKNQGSFGTCWAFAALTAMETVLLPEENIDFSEDHMSINNPYGLTQNDGGDYLLSMAYLTAWQGPVLEEDDPYGDGISNDSLDAVKHVQEIQLIASKDYEAIKKTVYKYGGVQSSLYTSMLNADDIQSPYYNAETKAYCYIGEEKPNHDIVIIGWDDHYSKENFNAELEGDGAFICRNSWGEEFGDQGNFYISYYDTNIGIHNVVYTRIEEPDNYDNIYQTDLCGWIGLLGYKTESAFFANVYTAKSREQLKAVSFYATGKDTEYTIYLCEKFGSGEDLSNSILMPVQSGLLNNIGYYTIDLEKNITFDKNQRYAVIIKITTPNAERPIAIEYGNELQSKNIDLTDGEGYISLNGDVWTNTEDKHACNVCLKVFTNYLEK